MGLIDGLTRLLFGSGGNVIRDTAELFRENAEAAGQREHDLATKALGEFGAEFALARRGGFDRLVDGLNRLPRPMLAFGTLGLFVSAMVDPVWFASRMQGIALVPDPLWWLLGAIVSFYFGARWQAKGQEFQTSMAATVARAAEVTANLRALRALEAGAGAAPVDAGAPGGGDAGSAPGANAALDDWRAALAAGEAAAPDADHA